MPKIECAASNVIASIIRMMDLHTRHSSKLQIEHARNVSNRTRTQSASVYSEGCRTKHETCPPSPAPY